MSGFNYEKDANGVVTVTMDMDGPVNSMSEAYASDIELTGPSMSMVTVTTPLASFS